MLMSIFQQGTVGSTSFLLRRQQKSSRNASMPPLPGACRAQQVMLANLGSSEIPENLASMRVNYKQVRLRREVKQGQRGCKRALVLDAFAAADALEQHAQRFQFQPRGQQRRLLGLPGRQRPQRCRGRRLFFLPPLRLRLALCIALRVTNAPLTECPLRFPMRSQQWLHCGVA